MATNGITSWAVDLAETGPIYPFQGSEVLMVMLGVAFWIGWHRIQYLRESAHLDKARHLGEHEKITEIVERY